jgi:hypothetical protein
LTSYRSIFKEGQALRTETTINDPRDFQPNKSLHTLPKLRAIGHHVNTRLLEVEQVDQPGLLGPSIFEHLQHPTRTATGQRVAALRFGDVRVHAVLSALCRFSHVPEGFRHRDLRPLVAGLLSRDLAAYSAGAMTYDLRRLRLHGLIVRVDGMHRYTLTAECIACSTQNVEARRSIVPSGRSTKRRQAGATTRSGASCMAGVTARSMRRKNSQAVSTAPPPWVACGVIVSNSNGRN